MNDRLAATHTLDQDNLRSRSIQGGSMMALAQLCKLALMFGSQIILARLLKIEAFGLIAMVGPVLGFVQVFVDLGLMQSVTQRGEISGRQLNGVFWASIGFSVVLTLLTMALAPVLTLAYREPRIFAMTLALASLIGVNGLALLQSAFLARQLRFGVLALCDVGSLFLGTAAGVIGAYLGLGYWSLVLSQAVATFANVILLWSFSSWRPSRPTWEPELAPMLKFGGNITLANLATYLNQALDNVMIGVVLGDIALGLYDRAWKLAVQPLSQVMAPINRVAVPVLSRLVDAPDRYRSAFVQMLHVLLVATTPGFVFLMLEADPVINFLFGAKWAPTAPIFAWICLGAVITPINSAIFWLFISQGRAHQQMRWSTVLAVINVTAYALGLRWGVVGVARCSAISVYLVQSPILFFVASREGPVKLATLVRVCLPFALSSAILALGLTALARAPLPGPIGFWLALFGCYPVALVLLTLTPSGREALISTWRVGLSFIERKPLV